MCECTHFFISSSYSFIRCLCSSYSRKGCISASPKVSWPWRRIGRPCLSWRGAVRPFKNRCLVLWDVALEPRRSVRELVSITSASSSPTAEEWRWWWWCWWSPMLKWGPSPSDIGNNKRKSSESEGSDDGKTGKWIMCATTGIGLAEQLGALIRWNRWSLSPGH